MGDFRRTDQLHPVIVQHVDEGNEALGGIVRGITHLFDPGENQRPEGLGDFQVIQTAARRFAQLFKIEPYRVFSAETIRNFAAVHGQGLIVAARHRVLF